MDQELLRKAKCYCEAKGYHLREQLGFGIHGGVWVAEAQNVGSRFALKLFHREIFYQRERDAYFRLRDHGVSRICGCDVPALVDHDDDAWAVMLMIVERPYVLDFAGSRLDHPIEFPEETLRRFLAEKEAQFGGEDWPKVKEIECGTAGLRDSPDRYLAEQHLGSGGRMTGCLADYPPFANPAAFICRQGVERE